MINGFRYFVKNNMEIILDTSTAMHYEGFSKFVEENERDIEASGKKIQVLSAVWFELIRNYNSVDKEKAEAANQAIAILSRVLLRFAKITSLTDTVFAKFHAIKA